MKLAKNASNKLKGIAISKIPKGRTPKLPITSHINTNPTNHDRNVVCSKVNFLLKIKIAIAKHNDQIPQTAPLIGCSGNVNPKFW